MAKLSREFISYFIGQGYDVNKKQYNDRGTSLHGATREKKYDIVELLLSKGAKSDIKDDTGKTAFDYAVDEGMKRIFRKFKTNK